MGGIAGGDYEVVLMRMFKFKDEGGDLIIKWEYDVFRWMVDYTGKYSESIEAGEAFGIFIQFEMVEGPFHSEDEAIERLVAEYAELNKWGLGI